MMKLKQIKLWIFSIGVMAFAGTGVFAQPDRLSTQQWKLVQANGRAVSNSNAYFEVNNTRTRFTGDTGCNRMFGGVWVSGNRIDFSRIGSTKKMCKLMPGNVAKSQFVNALDNAVRYQQSGNNLNLYNRRGRVVLKFTRLVKPAPDEGDRAGVMLEDKKWILESIKNRKTLVAVSGAFVSFDKEKGSSGGNSGCNVFGGEYTATKTTLKITEIIATLRACIEDNKMDVEREFLDGLRETNRYEIKNNRLFLYRGKALLLTFRGEIKT